MTIDTEQPKNEFTTYIEEPWILIEKYFKNHHLERLIRHQLESYNNLEIDISNP